MKKIYSFIIIMIICLMMPFDSKSQTVTCTVLQEPCTGNGILLVHTSGFVNPIVIQCFDPYYTSATIVTGTDYTFYNMEYFDYLSVTGAVFPGSTWPTGMNLPFVPDQPVVTPAICPALGSATITVNGGLYPDYVEWYDGTGVYPGTYIGTGNPMSLPAGQYRPKIFFGGCYLMWDSSMVYIPDQSPVTFYVQTTAANCTNGTATVFNVSGGTPPYSYLWSNGATTPGITGLSSGVYEVTVTDAIGCYKTQSVYVQQAVNIGTNPVVTQLPTCLDNNGKVMAFGSGGMSPYTYLWSDGQTTQEAINLSGGTSLSVIVTDQNGCLGTGSIFLQSSTPIAVTYSAIASSCTAPTGSATLSITGGTLPYTVTWSTFPVQTGMTASNLPPGNYHFTVTDAVGCIRTGLATIPPFSVISANAYSMNPVCPANTGTVGVNCSGAAPFTFSWSSGQTTQTVTNVPLGGYSCVITDVNGCSVTKYTSVAMQSPISLGFNITPATCRFSANGSIQALPVGGTPPYTYQWSNGSTTNPATNLLPGWYTGTVTDASGCYKTNWGYVGNSATTDDCYCTIEGTVYYDANANCTADPGENGIEHIQVKLEPFGSVFTNSSGHYSFQVPTGNYTLSEVIQYVYPLTTSCPANEPVSVPVTAASGCTFNHDFFNTAAALHDAHVVTLDDNYAVPGSTFRQKLIITNDGTLYEPNMLLNYYPDGQLPTMTTSPFPLLNSGTMWYNPISSISKYPGEGIVLTNFFNIPPNIPLGTVIQSTGFVSSEPPILNWVEDYTPWNNVINHQTYIVSSGSKDALSANGTEGAITKQVYPSGTGPEGAITRSDSVLDYVIHFQNTGTFYVENVVIMDTLDTDLDLSSIKVGAASHAFIAEFTAEGILKFTFPNIHLSYKAANEITSNGFICYSVKQKPQLPFGTEIKNSAAVFFDQNAPVMTGTTLNTITLGVGTGDKQSGKLSIHPNPATEMIYIDCGSSTGYLSVFDITGKDVFSRQDYTGVIELNVQNLPAGVYLVVMTDKDGVRFSGKFIKSH